MAKILTTDAIAPIKGYIDGKVGDLAEIVEGKCNTYVLSYSDTISAIESFIETEEYESDFICDAEGNDITSSISDYESVSLMNSGFNTNLASIGTQTDQYIILRNVPTTLPQASGRFEYVLAKLSELSLKIGDVFLVIETDVPDRWFAKDGNVFKFYKMETSKVEISDVVKLAGAQTITGVKTIANASSSDSPKLQFQNQYVTAGIYANGYQLRTDAPLYVGGNLNVAGKMLPTTSGTRDIGASDAQWKDFYLSGKINLNASNSTTITTNASGELVVDRNGTTIFNFGNTNGQAQCSYTFAPVSDGVPDLGSSSKKWKDLYLSGALKFDTYTYINQTQSNLFLSSTTGHVMFNSNAQPWSDSSFDLGGSARKWKDGYFSGNLYASEARVNYVGNSNTNLYAKGLLLAPDTNGTKDLGRSNFRWNDFYLAGKIDFGTKITGRTNTCRIALDNYDGVGIWSNNVRMANFYDNGIYFSKTVYVTNTITMKSPNNSENWKLIANDNGSMTLGYGVNTYYAMNTAGIFPTGNETRSCGASSLRWSSVYTKAISDGTNSVDVANIPSKATTVVYQGTFANGSFIMQKSLLTQGLYVFTYGNCSAFVLIMDTMWAYAHTSPIRTAMPVIYDTDGNCRPGTLGLYRTDSNGDPSANGDYVTVALFDSQGTQVQDDYQMTIIRTGML